MNYIGPKQVKPRVENLETFLIISEVHYFVCVCVRVRVRVRVCVCGHVYVVYEDTNLYNDMGMT